MVRDILRGGGTVSVGVWRVGTTCCYIAKSRIRKGGRHGRDGNEEIYGMKDGLTWKECCLVRKG